MKGRITTVLSLTGVLVAGSAAAMVNTQVLRNNGSNSSGQVTVGSTNDSAAPTSETTALGDPINGEVLTSSQVTKIQSSVLTSTQALYQIGDAGLVTLDTAGNVLTVVSVAPNSGWTVVKTENYTATDIEVKLQSGNTIIEFRANLQAGVITTSVESKIVGDGGNGGTTPASGSIDDDDDGDDDSGHEDESDDSVYDDESEDDSVYGEDDD